ncbi:tetratricopeptide repeat protein [Burkholderiaceae bacterium DAT-1]|nr:tetratricopeptide repeat protein [Burkholderiaceae bacterium DAT-1]
MNIFNSNKRKAQNLHQSAQELHDKGDEDGALNLYKQAISLQPDKSESYYNIGLIYKYRSEWENSLEYNAKAYQISPDDEAARWNLAIAATALRKWDIARKAWEDNGIKLTGTSGPIEMNFGITPIRLNPDSTGEVVWAQRIDPVRAVIQNIPLPESGFHFQDIVLHDGAAVGYRQYQGREYAVFNVLELFESSNQQTIVIHAQASDEAIHWLDTALTEVGGALENWSSSIRQLCKACSEGRPHESHDHELDEIATVDRKLGVSIPVNIDIQEIVSEWKSIHCVDIQSIDN